MNLQQVKRIHFIGIGGIGISYVAHFFLRQNAIVSGSDIARSVVTDQLAELGAAVFEGHDASYIKDGMDLVVYNDAIPNDNPELLRAKELGIPVLSNFQVVGLISKDYTTIVVAGNKGKTTTSAMLATILEAAGCDPTAMIGSIVNEWKCNFKKGASRYLVVEGDEYKEHFLELEPDIAIITNMAADHLDYYGTEGALIDAFQKFVDKLPNDGLLVINQDDHMTRQLRRPNCQVLTFGMETTADVLMTDRRSYKESQDVDLNFRGQEIGPWALPVPGKYNVYNAMAAGTVALHLGIEPEKIGFALSNFKGTWRRFQILGQYREATIISDYAHHPTAVHATLEGARDFYPDRRLVAVFQPHTRHRTKALLDDFVLSLDNADIVMIPNIYSVAGREVVTDEEMNSSMVVDRIKQRDASQNRERMVVASGDLQATKDMVDQIIQKDDVVLFMGAGDVYLIAEALA